MALVAREIASGIGHCEGPVIRPDGEIVFVSYDHGRLYKIRDGKTGVLSEIGHMPNGATEWSDGTIYVTQAGGRKRWGPNEGTGGIQAVARDGSVRWVTQDPISPNDLCFGPDGWLYVTDPTRPREARDDGRLFRCNIETGEAQLLCTVPWYPNGIGFGIDDALYVAVTGHRRIMRFPFDDGRLGPEELFIQLPITHRPDGFLFDTEGNIVIGCNAENRENDDTGQIRTYDRAGTLVDVFVPGSNKSNTNVALGPDRVLVITATDIGTVFAVDDWPHAGLPLYPFRTSINSS